MELERELLVRAVTGGGSRALNAFVAWRDSVDLEAAIDSEVLAMLPLLYGNLQKLGLDDPLMGRLKGFCRRTWYENQGLLGSAQEALASLAKAGVECLLVGDLPLVLAYYESLSARRIRQVDIVVLPHQARLAAELLRGSGWAAGGPLRGEEVAYNHLRRFIGPLGQVLDLHWHVLEAAANETADAFFWDSDQEFALDGTLARRLSSTGLLVYFLLGASSRGVPMRGLWIADTLAIIRGAAEELDWGQIAKFALRQKLAVRLRGRLELLAGYGVRIPEPMLRTLQEARVSLPESIDAIVLRGQRRYKKRISVWRCGVLADYLRSDRRATLLNRPADFSHFVRHRWGLKGRKEILTSVARHLWRTTRPGWS
jgi:hypothetical protein